MTNRNQLKEDLCEDDQDPLGFHECGHYVHAPEDSMRSATEECAQAKLHVYAEQEHEKDNYVKNHPVISTVKANIKRLWLQNSRN